MSSFLTTIILCIALSAAKAQTVQSDSVLLSQSIDQRERDEAATRLKQSFRMPDKKKWDDLVARIKVGLAEGDAKAILKPWEDTAHISLGTMNHESLSYRLDDVYMVFVTFQRFEHVVNEARLIESFRSYWVKPPAKYTGTWTNYFVNGIASTKIEFKDGVYDGTNKSFHPNGALCVEQHYSKGECHGTDTGYYPSGALSYKGQYSHGKRIGVWTHYNEDGSIKHTENVNG